MKIKVLSLYPELLNLYGDRGNIEIFKYRCLERSVDVEIQEVGIKQDFEKKDWDKVDIVFMGGGSDLNQKELYQDLLMHKKGFLSDYLLSGGVGLFICGAYQLLGNYYQTSDGEKIPGLGIFDFYTINEGQENRNVGKIKSILSSQISDHLFDDSEHRILYGFENHGGQTYLGASVASFGEVSEGFGNNRIDKTEGLLFQNTIGTYLHGPILSLNPSLCDWLIKMSLKKPTFKLSKIDDSLIEKARFYLN